MTNQVFELWLRVLSDNITNLSALYDSISPFLIVIIGVGTVSAAVALVFNLFRGKK